MPIKGFFLIMICSTKDSKSLSIFMIACLQSPKEPTPGKTILSASFNSEASDEITMSLVPPRLRFALSNDFLTECKLPAP